MQAVECLNGIFKDEASSKTQVLINCISDIIPELLGGIIQGINLTEGDAYFMSLETIFMYHTSDLGISLRVSLLTILK